MSLLLEALKKAEKAKEEAQRRAKGGGLAIEGAPASATPDPDATVLDNRHVTTRDELPDRKSTRLNSSHSQQSRMPSSA